MPRHTHMTSCLIAALTMTSLGCAVQQDDTAAMGSRSSEPAMAAAEEAKAAAPTKSTFDRPGYATFVEDGRLWIFRDGSEELKQFKTHGEPAKVVIRPGAGPNRMTVKAVDTETIEGYMLSKPGYVTFVEDGRLWIFRDGSDDLKQFMEKGEPAKVVIRPGAGPNRMTVKAVDTETIEGYMARR